ncbi:MAG: DUF1684 domain-containing protein [Xanthomonadales bacterium]|nr:DUF1684 domain-containing protein [Gammaproteobacteria bacterium]NNL03805.1 DUF1684 domain-containing protein [Xanthomonadales bacterium]
MKILITGLMLSGLFISTPGAVAGEADYEQHIEDWREARHQRLADPDGWLTLVGLEWLDEGSNSVGSAKDSDARIPGGPVSWGTIHLTGDAMRFVPTPGSGIEVDGQAVEEADLVADSQGQPTVVRSGGMSFHVIDRESYALRVKDRRAPTLVAFEGVPVYGIEPDWRVEGRLQRAEEGATIEIANVLGQTSPSPVYGTFEFERDGQPLSMIALGTEESQDLWFLFADKTSGRETYGAGRFLYSEGMPEDGKLVVDFNKAYNPPCAFNDYSTCPLPPQQNRLKVAVRAGEKKYHD